ncbi:MAG: hypothetical protein JJU36_08030 [Phycisphaeraceae bacterium]|nr:hypothetical protein [Phycisphaeraceae bacterium]
MTADPLKKVQTGQKLRIPAAAYNAFVDVVADLKQRQRSIHQDPSATVRHSGIVLVSNASGAARERFDALAVTGPVFTPTDNLDSFRNRVALRGGLAQSADDAGRFVILLEPLAPGAIGMAMAVGICPARVQVSDAEHRYADVDDSGDGLLHSAELGAAHILWKEAGTGTRWAIVRIGSPPPMVLDDLLDVETPDVAAGDLLVREGSGEGQRWVNLGIGTNGHVLTVSGGMPVWAEPTSGGGGGNGSGGDPVTGAAPWLERIGDTMHHTGPGPSVLATDMVTDVRTEDDMAGWNCGRIRVYRRPLDLDARGHITLGAESDDWADVYY